MTPARTAQLHLLSFKLNMIMCFDRDAGVLIVKKDGRIVCYPHDMDFQTMKSHIVKLPHEVGAKQE
jgi:phosphatidylserine decarboxylase